MSQPRTVTANTCIALCCFALGTSIFKELSQGSNQLVAMGLTLLIVGFVYAARYALIILSLVAFLVGGLAYMVHGVYLEAGFWAGFGVLVAGLIGLAVAYEMLK